MPEIQDHSLVLYEDIINCSCYQDLKGWAVVDNADNIIIPIIIAQYNYQF